MSVDGLEEVVGKLELAFKDIAGERTEAAITEMLISAAAHAAALTPVDSSNLLNSQGRQVAMRPGGVDGVLYYGARYAKWVHEMPGKLKGQPRAHFGRTSNVYKYGGPQQVVEFGGGSQTGNYWDPNAEPQFLLKGVNEMIANDKDEIIRRNYEL